MSPALAVRGTGKFGWGSLLASGDFDFITSASGTAVASISIDNCFSAGYDHYLVMRDLLGSTDNALLNVRLRAASTDASGADYRTQFLSGDSTTVAGGRSTGLNQWNYGIGYAQTTAFGFGQLWISNPFAAVRTTGWTNHSYDADANIAIQSVVLEHDAATSYDGLSVIPNGGTVTGSIFIFGLAV